MTEISKIYDMTVEFDRNIYKNISDNSTITYDIVIKHKNIILGNNDNIYNLKQLMLGNNQTPDKKGCFIFDMSLPLYKDYDPYKDYKFQQGPDCRYPCPTDKLERQPNGPMTQEELSEYPFHDNYKLYNRNTTFDVNLINNTDDYVSIQFNDDIKLINCNNSRNSRVFYLEPHGMMSMNLIHENINTNSILLLNYKYISDNTIKLHNFHKRLRHFYNDSMSKWSLMMNKIKEYLKKNTKDINIKHTVICVFIVYILMNAHKMFRNKNILLPYQKSLKL
jgi:hypothetical protein